MVYSYTKRSISAVLIPSRIFSSTQSNTAVFNSPLFLIPSICSGNLMSFREGTSLPFFPNTSLFYQLLSKACPEWDAIDTLLSSSYLNFLAKIRIEFNTANKATPTSAKTAPHNEAYPKTPANKMITFMLIAPMIFYTLCGTSYFNGCSHLRWLVCLNYHISTFNGCIRP